MFVRCAELKKVVAWGFGWSWGLANWWRQMMSLFRHPSRAAARPAQDDDAKLFFRRPERRALRPLGDGLPIGIVLAGELPAAGMEGVAAGFGRQRMQQNLRGERIVGGLHDLRHRIEILACLLLGPGRLAVGKLFQAQHVVGVGVAHDARRVARPLDEEDRLHLGLVEVVVERAGGGYERSARQRKNRSGDDKANGHASLPNDYSPFRYRETVLLNLADHGCTRDGDQLAARIRRSAAARASAVISAPASMRAISSRRRSSASSTTRVATRLPLASASLVMR